MAHESANEIQVGMAGELAGQRYEVAGRIRMSTEQDGQVYSWFEYYLLGPEGASATLVQESGERGTEWRLFRMIEPSHPISATEAASKRVGDMVDLMGDRLRVSCVAQSRVVSIEGRAGEGVEEGDIADYFNAESGNQMIVVSCTGGEVEVFRGVQLPGYAVQRAFGLKTAPRMPTAARTPIAFPSSLSATGVPAEDESSAWKGVLISGIIIAVVITVIAFRFIRESPPRTVQRPAPKATLRVGQIANIRGTQYQIGGHALVDVSRVGRKEGWHEYSLTDDTGAAVLLVQSADGWKWLHPIAAAPMISAKEAGAKKLGDAIKLEDRSLVVSDLFLSSASSTEGNVLFGRGTVRYGLEARGSGQRILARWSDSLVVYQVVPATMEDVAAFGAK